MTDTVGCSDSVCAVQHAGDENKSIACVTGGVDPIFPHKSICRISRTIDVWHGRAHDDCDEDTGDDQEATDVTGHWKCSVTKHNQSAAQPDADEIADEYVPRCLDVIRVIKAVHRYCHVGQ